MRLSAEDVRSHIFFDFLFPCKQRGFRRFCFAIENAIENIFFSRKIAFYLCPRQQLIDGDL